MPAMFLQNAWYVACWKADLGPTPKARTILGEPVVLFRGPDGKPAALEDRCCHRSLPLSLGKMLDGRLQCGYHGLEFDGTGAVVRVPGQTHVPPGARVKSYPVVEKLNAIWIWMGDPAQADESRIPNLFWLADPAWVPACGEIHMQANYQLLVDNLLDLTHVSYLHLRTIAGDPAEGLVPVKTTREGERVTIARWMLEFPPPPMFAAAGGFKGLVDRWQIVNWEPPSTVFLDIGCADAGSGAPQGNRARGISMWSTHLITPETETSTHYHWCYARNYRPNEPGVTELLQKGGALTFGEDVAAIEVQQKNLLRFAGAPSIDINIDKAPLLARRILADRIAAEQGARAAE